MDNHTRGLSRSGHQIDASWYHWGRYGVVSFAAWSRASTLCCRRCIAHTSAERARVAAALVPALVPAFGSGGGTGAPKCKYI